VAAIALRQVTYAYPDGVVAIEGVDLDVEVGERVAIVGPNGAGKSTLLHLTAGFQWPFGGEVRVFGELLTRKSAPAIRRHLGLVFQDPDDQVFMPRVWDDVAFGPRNLGWPEARVREAVERALAGMGIADLAERVPHRLSFGQKKRVALAGVLAMDPDVLLLDEPTTGLDPRARHDLLGTLRILDKTLIIATHHLEEVGVFADRLVVLDRRKIAEGTPREILARKDVLAALDLETLVAGMPPVVPALR